MKKRAKKATQGERIALTFYPEGTIDHAITRKALAREIDADIRRAVREATKDAFVYGRGSGIAYEKKNYTEAARLADLCFAKVGLKRNVKL